MAEVTGEKGFAAEYWRQRRDTKIDPDTFFGKFEHFRRFLEELGIHEHPECCAEIDGEIEAIRRYTSPLEGMYGIGVRPRLVVEHDAKMRLLINRLRGGDRWGSFSDVEYWFLTESTSLPTYARIPVDEPSPPRHPFCILSSTWAQIVRALVPRTDDLNDMIVGLLASPYVGYKSPMRGDHLDAVEKTVSRIDSLKDIPASVAVAMVNDEAMSRKIAGETDPDEVSRLVEESLTKKAEELATRLEETAAETVRADRERAEAEERAREADERESAHLAERVSAEQEAERARREAAEAEQAKEAVLQKEAKLQEEIAKTKARERAEQEGRKSAEGRVETLRIALGLIVAVAVVGGSCALLLTDVVKGTGGALGLIALSAGLAYVALRVASEKIAKEVRVLVAVIAAVVAIAAAVIASDAGDEGPAKSDSTTAH
jgi:hypothetical protein